MVVDNGSDQKSDLQPHWMAEHARLKNEKDEKNHNLMRWLILSELPSLTCCISFVITTYLITNATNGPRNEFLKIKKSTIFLISKDPIFVK